MIVSLNEYEIQILLLACYLHDVGMALGEDEAGDIAITSDFQLYQRQANVKDKDKSDKELLWKFVNPGDPISKKEWERHRDTLAIGALQIVRESGTHSRHNVLDTLGRNVQYVYTMIELEKLGECPKFVHMDLIRNLLRK